MTQLTRNFDMAAIVVLVLLLGVAQAPRVRAARILTGTNRVLTVTQQRVVPRIQERTQRYMCNTRISRLIFSEVR